MGPTTLPPEASYVHGMVAAQRARERKVGEPNILEHPGFLAATRECNYVVVRRPGSWFWKRWQVLPAKATGPLYQGGYWQCLRVKQALECARSNGAWVALDTEYH